MLDYCTLASSQHSKHRATANERMDTLGLLVSWSPQVVASHVDSSPGMYERQVAGKRKGRRRQSQTQVTDALRLHLRPLTFHTLASNRSSPSAFAPRISLAPVSNCTPCDGFSAESKALLVTLEPLSRRRLGHSIPSTLHWNSPCLKKNWALRSKVARLAVLNLGNRRPFDTGIFLHPRSHPSPLFQASPQGISP